MIDADFAEAVKTTNMRMVRIKLGNIIAIDPTLKTYTEMREYAERYISDLYEENNEELNWDKSTWSKEYYNDQQTELSFNFSHERLDLLCAMAKELYPDRISNINETRASENEDGAEKVKDGVGNVLEFVGEMFESGGRWLRKKGQNLRRWRSKV